MDNDLYAFSLRLGERESGNKYLCVNKFGFIGKYQMGKPRLWDLGISIDSWKPKWYLLPNRHLILTRGQFLSNPLLQEQTFQKHVKLHLALIKRKYLQYVGFNINGIHITESGMMAGLHLKGEGSSKYPGLKQFLKEETNSTDGLGTTIAEYVFKFAGYDLRDEIRFYVLLENLKNPNT